ncbi:WD40 repeat domain-containing protein [Paenibacillus sp. MMS20-IR301]|uniref:WD40 repeat domain-containing protein n=1 Tax=Paenibacillus sp. MMS20-IR301 TaxID=2895946 RepID=UPI0028E22681|nr:WD40 repeat domain-containing protein [Paenibacillus sp. MMS20-IR301]WNS46099.1 WD40 repeat domain-containing protein [Paenibacillus sp. MMS20-IR301]
MIRKYTGWVSAILFLLLLLSGCRAGVHSETVIIPDEGETEQAPQSSNSFQVKAIYRLADKFTNDGYWLGWTAADSLTGAFKTAGTSESFNLITLTYPYEQSENIKAVKDNAQLELSPDGKYTAEISSSNTGTSLKVVPLKDGKETEVASFSSSGQQYLQDISWSGNSRFLSYLVLDVSDSDNNSVYLYDLQTHASRQYPLKDMEQGNTLLSINVSDDGHSVLFTLFEAGRAGKTALMFGRMTDPDIKIMYTRETVEEQSTWISNDQFTFLGPDGTLYEYDQRNSELSVILENISAYKLSDDKKIIAYYQQDDEAVYVGRMQGRNVVYKEPVYHGLVPSAMFWNTDHTKLLLQGASSYANPFTGQNDSSRGPSYIIELK